MGTATRDSLFVRVVEELIPRATREADEACVKAYGADQENWDSWYWDRVFHSAMDRLAVNAGLRSKRYDS